MKKNSTFSKKKWADCGIRKSGFVKEQEAKGLLSS